MTKTQGPILRESTYAALLRERATSTRREFEVRGRHSAVVLWAVDSGSAPDQLACAARRRALVSGRSSASSTAEVVGGSLVV
jgi:hypothetical protein